MHRLPIAIIAALLLLGGNAVAAGSGEAVYGTWRNPKGTIDVRTQPCADALCGQIIRAAPRAIEAARRKGVATLIGTQLLSDYRRSGDKWAGRVFVPDMGRSFSSRIALIGPNQLQISGCLIGGMFCKSQVWTRV